jgi:hypothetical protein
MKNFIYRSGEITKVAPYQIPGDLVQEKRLSYSKCNNSYEYEKDKKGRYIRGKKYEVVF